MGWYKQYGVWYSKGMRTEGVKERPWLLMLLRSISAAQACHWAHYVEVVPMLRMVETYAIPAVTLEELAV